MQSVSLCLTFLPEFPLQPSEGALLITVCSTFFLPLTVFKVSCTLCASAILHVSLPSIRIHPQKWLNVGGFTLLLSGRCFPVPLDQLPVQELLTKEVKSAGGLTVTSLLSPLYFKMCLLLRSSLQVALSALFSSACGLTFLVWIIKQRGTGSRCLLISFAPVLTGIGVPTSSGVCDF